MKYIFDLISLIRFTRKSSYLGLLFLAAKKSNIKFIYLISFIFAPFVTLYYFLNPKKEINLGDGLKKLGPIFIKFGQGLSSRPDIIGEDIANTLGHLQDKLEPFATSIARQIIEQEHNQKLEDIFENFSEKAVAAASVAQVHKATLKNGKKVAVKILRPNISKIYKQDIQLLYSIARICNSLFLNAKKVKLKEAVAIFEKTMKFELDLKNEAAACSEMYDNAIKDDDVIIPEVYWEYSTSKVLVLEWLEGFSIYDDAKIEKYGIVKEELTKKLAIIFLNQAFRDGYFHADLHPGNIFVQKNGKIALVDFGIVGRLSDRDRFSMAEVLHSFINRDYKRVAEIHVEIGFVPKDTNIMDFALACRAAAEPIIGKPINKVSIGHLLESLFRIVSDFGMETQPQLILLQKTIILVEGIGQMLDPNVNIWKLSEPWMKKWATKNISLDAKIYRLVKKVIKEIVQNIK